MNHNEQLPTTLHAPAHTRATHKPASVNINHVCVILALMWLVLVGFTLSPDVDDFQQYWRAAVDLVRFGDPYASIPAVSTGKRQFIYPYPPLLAYLIQPMAYLSRWHGQLAWFGVNSVLLVVLIGLCVHLSESVLARRFWGVVVVATLIVPPTRLSLQLGQVSILLAVLLVSGFALRQRAAPLSGALLALASLIKLYPALLGVYYLLRRARSVVGWSIGFGALILVITSAVYSVQHYSSYIQKILLSGVYPYAAEFNLSLLGFWRRLLTTSNYAVPLAYAPTLATLLTLLSGAAVLAVCMWVGRGATDALEEQLHFGVWVCGMLLLSPINGVYNLVVLLLPVLTVLRYLEQHPDRAIRVWLVLGTLLSCWPPAWTNWQPTLYQSLHRGVGLFLLTPAIYGLLILLGVLAHVARQYKCKQQAPA